MAHDTFLSGGGYANQPLKLAKSRQEKRTRGRESLARLHALLAGGERPRPGEIPFEAFQVEDVERDIEEDPYTGREAQKRDQSQQALLDFLSPQARQKREEEQTYEIEKVGEPSRISGKTLRDVEGMRQTGATERQRIQSAGDVAAAGMRGRGGMTSLPASIVDRVAGSEAALDILTNLRKQFRSDYVGPASGRVNLLMQKIPGLSTDPDFARFGADTSTLRNAVVKAITGAQMSEPEAKRIMGQIPVETDKPEVWQAKADATEVNIRNMVNKIAQLTGNPRIGRMSVDDADTDLDMIADPDWGVR